MRLALFTLPLHTNYGGIIQAYALQTALERLGHEVVVMDRPVVTRYLPRRKRPWTYTRRLVKKLFVDRHAVIFREAKYNRELPIVRQHTDRFISQYIHRRIIDRPDSSVAWDVDGIVVGSDQIWRIDYFGWSYDLSDMFLSFAETWPVRRWAYGASFGVDTWDFPMEQTPRYARLMQLFEGVSVREDTGVTLCRDHLKVAAEHVLDPTMLLAADDYRALIARWQASADTATAPAPADGRALLTTYMLDPTDAKQSWVERVARERGLSPRELSNRWEYVQEEPLADRVIAPVEAWLRGFADARMVLTDSFHGCVFSIIFRKPFVTIGNKGRGLSRMESLMRMFGLEDHLLASPADYDPERSYALPADIDEQIASLRARSLAFLRRIGECRTTN